MLALRLLSLLLLASLGACASGRLEPPPSDPRVADPFEPVNRAVFAFNGAADRAVIRPAAKTYEAVVPRLGREGLGNVADNIRAPVWLANEVLQGDWQDAGHTLERFVANTLFGLGGLFDVASRGGVPKLQEDLGQTLGAYGVGHGPYLVLPILGPSSLRDLSGRFGDAAAQPLNYVAFEGETALRVTTRAGAGLNRRLQADAALQRIQESADPYAQLRSLYLQQRASAVHEDADPYADLPDFE